MISTYRSRLRVLIVEDDRDAAESLALAVGTADCDVHDSCVANDVLFALDEFMPHVVLLGFSPAAPDSREVLRRLQTIEGADRPILISTRGHVLNGSPVGNRLAEYDALLPEPLDKDRLLHYLSACANKLLPAD